MHDDSRSDSRAPPAPGTSEQDQAEGGCMIQLRRHPVRVALLAVLLLAAATCSESGGKQEEAPAGGANAGQANTPEMTVAMITPNAPGDTFWDIIRKGAEAAAAKDNIKFQYSADPDASKQATLIQSAIDAKVDGIAVTLPTPATLAFVVKKAVDAGIPVVAFNAGIGDYRTSGALSYFGSDESLAGETAGKRASDEGYKNLLCVIQEQGGKVQLEARCDGVKKTFSGNWQKLYVNGQDLPSVRSTIGAKLAQDKSIDLIVTLGADFALNAITAVQEAPAARPRSEPSTSTPRSRPRSSPTASWCSRSTSSPAPGLPGGRLAVALQEQRQHPRRRAADADEYMVDKSSNIDLVGNETAGGRHAMATGMGGRHTRRPHAAHSRRSV